MSSESLAMPVNIFIISNCSRVTRKLYFYSMVLGSESCFDVANSNRTMKNRANLWLNGFEKSFLIPQQKNNLYNIAQLLHQNVYDFSDKIFDL